MINVFLLFSFPFFDPWSLPKLEEAVPLKEAPAVPVEENFSGTLVAYAPLDDVELIKDPRELPTISTKLPIVFRSVVSRRAPVEYDWLDPTVSN